MTVFNSNTSVAYKLQLEVIQQSQSVVDNTSTLSWTLKMIKTNSAYSANNSGGEKFKVLIDGLTVLNANKAWDLRTASSVTIASGTKTVTHESNGTKFVPVSFSYTPSMSSPYYPGALSGSGTFTCTTIPRISTVSVNKTSADVGTSVTINIARAASSYTHNLYYKVASGGNVVIGTGIATSKVWDIPSGLLPNNSSAPVTITCDTYNGSTKVGTSTCAMTVTVPSAAVPSITAVTVSESADTSDIETKFGIYVQNQSCLDVSIEAAGIYGSTISSYSTIIDGTTYTGNTFTTNPIASSGEVTIKTTIRDSRGKTATYTETVSVAEYTAPTLSNVYASRCDENGLAKEDGTYLKVEYTYSISSVNGMNDKLLEIQYKADGSDTWNAFITDSSEYTRTDVTVRSSSELLDTDASYAVRIMVSDYFYSGETAVVNVRQVSAAFTLINFGANGRSIAIGQQSSNDGRLECAIPANFTGGLFINGIDVLNYLKRGLYLIPSTTSLESIDSINASNLKNYSFNDSQIINMGEYGTSASINTSVNNKLNNYLVEKTFTQDNQTINKGASASFSQSVAYAGYTPVGVKAINITNASNGGQGSSYVDIKSFNLSDTTSEVSLRFNEATTGYANAKIKITRVILYRKNM